MNRLENKITWLKKNKRKALVTYVTAGYPDLASTESIFKTLTDSGADIIELGVPFSDPIADGPTIQFSSDQALKKNMTLAKVFSLVKSIRKYSDTPVILMGYTNPLIRNGIESTARAAAASGVDGFIIPDLIPEEALDIRKSLKKYGLSLIFLAAPNSSTERLRYLDSTSSPFLYIVSLTGVTGGRKQLPASAIEFIKRTKRIVKQTRFVGFGISSAEQVKSLKSHADGVIIGSSLIDIIRKYPNREQRAKQLTAYVSSLRKALD